MSDLTRGQIRRLSQLAHLNPTDEELVRVSGELDQIVDSVARVQEAVDEDVPTTSHPIPLQNVFRADVVRGVLSQEDALAGAPDTEAGQFKVPAILDEENGQHEPR